MGDGALSQRYKFSDFVGGVSNSIHVAVAGVGVEISPKTA